MVSHVCRWRMYAAASERLCPWLLRPQAQLMLQVPQLQPSGGPAEVLHSLAAVSRSGKRDCATALGIDSSQNDPRFVSTQALPAQPQCSAAALYGRTVACLECQHRPAAPHTLMLPCPAMHRALHRGTHQRRGPRQGLCALPRPARPRALPAGLYRGVRPRERQTRRCSRHHIHQLFQLNRASGHVG